MVYLPDLQREEKARAERMRRAYDKVCQVRKNETSDDTWRREKAGLEWIADYLLESDCFLKNCIFDGIDLKKPAQSGPFNAINAGYRFGFDIPLGGPICFSLYAMDIYEKRNKEIHQCPKCKVVYSLPKEIDVLGLRKLKRSEQLIFAGN